MTLLTDVIVFESDKHFKLRIDSSLRKLGVIFITCYKDWMEIEFRGDFGLIIQYPENIDDLPDAVESELRLRTELFESNIQTIKAYISKNLELIKGALKQTK